jgi:methylenetetrahydrofolate reductase (NADPH)
VAYSATTHVVRAVGKQTIGQALAVFLRAPRYEILPTDGVLEKVRRHVPKDVTVTVTASPSKGMPATIHLAIHLAQLGYHTVPHLSARLIRNRVELGQILGAIHVAGIRNVFVVAGDAREPAGEFPDALSLLAALPPDHGLAEIGIAGYPESHPFIHDDMTIQAMWDKRRIATYIVSNMSFDPETIKRWVERVRRRGVTLPIYIGMAGVADPARLLRLSTKIGVADAARFLRGHPSWVARMLRPGGYEPGRFVTSLLPEFAQPDLRVAGLHVFTFNEIEPTEKWRQEMLARVA